MSKCDFDCDNCKYKDCRNDELTLKDYEFSRELDKSILDEAPVDYGVGSRKNRKPYDAKYYLENKAKHLATCNTYRQNNREKIAQHNREVYDANKEEVQTRRRELYQQNLEENRLRKRLYYQEHKEEINRRRRERKKLKNDNTDKEQSAIGV